MYQYGKRVIIIELSVNFHKEFTDYIAGSIKHVYYNDKIIVAAARLLGTAYMVYYPTPGIRLFERRMG